jgi:hypothetical protein
MRYLPPLSLRDAPALRAFTFLAAYGCAHVLCLLPLGDEFAMNFEGVDVFFDIARGVELISLAVSPELALQL